MMDLNPSQAARAETRLRQEEIVWLTTVNNAGQPQSSPVWFVWDGVTFLIYSRPNQKVRNIAHNTRVSLHLNDDGHGGDIVTIQGEAAFAPDAPPPNANPAYLAKYRAGIARIGLTPDSYAAAFSRAIRITPRQVRVW